MARLLHTLLLLIFACFQVFALPTIHGNPRDVLRHSPFRALRNTLIEWIWSIPAQPSAAHVQTLLKSQAQYGEDLVLRFTIRTKEEAEAFEQAAQSLYLDIWESTNDWVDVRVSKDTVSLFLELLPSTLHKAYTPVIYDLANAIANTYPIHNSKTLSMLDPSKKLEFATPYDLFFHDYQPLSVIYPWMRLMASLFPSRTELITIGESAEGRSIPAFRISAPEQEQDSSPRQTILVSGGSHAREWISTSTTLFIAHNLMTRYNEPFVSKILKHFDFVLIPTLNPDGYQYTWTTDRLWRKTRQTTSLPFCHGIDLDRSFSFGWDGDQGIDNPCSESFAGNRSFAAVEAYALSQWARNETQSNEVHFAAFIDLHSYSQQVLYPYSFTCEEDPHNLEDLEEVGFNLAKSFRISSGHYYGVGSACEGNIAASKAKESQVTTRTMGQGGSAIDFFHHDLGVKYAYQIKLRDTGSYGFLLPRSDIVPSGREATEAMLDLGRYLLSNKGIERGSSLEECKKD